MLSSFTVNVFAARNKNYNRYRNTPTPSVSPTKKPTATPTIAPTATPVVTSTPTATSRPTVAPTATAVPTAIASTPITNAVVYVTYYGWPDNDPAGNAIAYPKEDGYPTIHNGAGGTGTYDNPITFAAKIGRFPIGTKIYVPYIKKYVILEDTCASCTTNWIDIWLESDGNFLSKVIECEEHFTKENVAVEVNPPAGREVITTPLFDKTTGICQN